MGEITTDAFLGGAIRIRQPKDGFRAGVDAVFLAAATPAQSGQNILELGCGVATPLLCLSARVKGLQLTGIELQQEYAALAIENADFNRTQMRVIEANLAQLPPELRQESFDHVITNPPYYDRNRSSVAQNAGRDTALGGVAPMELWISVAAKRLKPKGYLTLIQHITRLPEVLIACEGKLGSVEVMPLQSRPGRAPDLFLLRARKSGRGAFKMLAPKLLHNESSAPYNSDYTEEIENVLRHGAALQWG